MKRRESRLRCFGHVMRRNKAEIETGAMKNEFNKKIIEDG